jgi:hypothetical protein
MSGMYSSTCKKNEENNLVLRTTSEIIRLSNFIPWSLFEIIPYLITLISILWKMESTCLLRCLVMCSNKWPHSIWGMSILNKWTYLTFISFSKNKISFALHERTKYFPWHKKITPTQYFFANMENWEIEWNSQNMIL